MTRNTGNADPHEGDEEMDETEELEECEPEAEGCEPEESASDNPKGGKGGKGGKKGGAKTETKPAATAPAPPKPAPAPAVTKFQYPFNVRYNAEFLDLMGFVDGQTYNDAQIKELLIANGWTEFADFEPAFHMSTTTNTLVITIRGSKKGGLKDLANRISGLLIRSAEAPHQSKPSRGLIAMMPARLLRQVEQRFIETYQSDGTEDRVLIYSDEQGNLGAVNWGWLRTRVAVQGDLPLTLELHGRLWDLAFDLHSHHVMGLGWSSIDTANECIRGPVFGVCSWRKGEPDWLFRRWLGPRVGFEDLKYDQVVTNEEVRALLLEAGADE